MQDYESLKENRGLAKRSVWLSEASVDCGGIAP